MPIYDYFCDTCENAFTELRPMAEHRAPHPCPACGTSARRILGAPRLSALSPQARLAHETNERSAHEPRVSGEHRCGPGCSHGGRPLRSAAPRARPRPWMLGH